MQVLHENSAGKLSIRQPRALLETENIFILSLAYNIYETIYRGTRLAFEIRYKLIKAENRCSSRMSGAGRCGRMPVVEPGGFLTMFQTKRETKTLPMLSLNRAFKVKVCFTASLFSG